MKRLSPLGSKSFELGIYTNYRLRKNDNLLHLNLGLSWLYQSFKIRDGLYYQHQAGNTLLVPYGSELTKSKVPHALPTPSHRSGMGFLQGGNA